MADSSCPTYYVLERPLCDTSCTVWDPASLPRVHGRTSVRACQKCVCCPPIYNKRNPCRTLLTPRLPAWNWNIPVMAPAHYVSNQPVAYAGGQTVGNSLHLMSRYLLPSSFYLTLLDLSCGTCSTEYVFSWETFKYLTTVSPPSPLPGQLGLPLFLS